MIDTTQILIITVVTILTILLTVVGIQIVYILKEFRKLMEKVNKILDNAVTASNSVTKTISGFTGVTNGLKTAFSLFGFLKKTKEKENGRE